MLKKSSSRPELLLNVKSQIDSGYADIVKKRTPFAEELGLQNKLRRRFENTSKGMKYVNERRSNT